MGQEPDSPAGSGKSSDGGPKRLIARFREATRSRHYSLRTEQAYWYWIRCFVFFSGKKHPAEMGAAEVTGFLNWLATERNVAAATQNQALSALLFLYQKVLGVELPWLASLVRAKRPVRVPAVLTEAEVRRLLGELHGVKWLMAALLYGAGLRQAECLALRVKDVDFAYRHIVVRDGKGARDRVVPLPEATVQPLQEHLGRVRALHRRDLREAMVRCGCRMRWRANIRAPRATGHGSSCFRRRTARLIPAAAPFAATTSIPTRSAARSSRRRSPPASSSR